MNTIYYTLFCQNTGGNHIRNLISLGCNTSAEYHSAMLNSYNNISTRNIHLTDMSFITSDKIPNSLESVRSAESPVSICGHFFALLSTVEELVKMGNLKIIVCDIPGENKPAWLRMRVSSFGMHDPYIMSEQRMLYTTDTVKKISRLPDDSIVDLSTDLVHQPDIIPVISFLNSKLNLNLPIDVCRELHTLWFNKNYSFV